MRVAERTKCATYINAIALTPGAGAFSHYCGGTGSNRGARPVRQKIKQQGVNMGRVAPKPAVDTKPKDETPVCPKCGAPIQMGDWPWCPHQKLPASNHLWNWVK